MLTLSKEKEKIIEFIVDNPTKKIRVRELAKQLELSPAYHLYAGFIGYYSELITDEIENRKNKNQKDYLQASVEMAASFLTELSLAELF
jgi:hypothetical protein